jgi:hypothetical protein
MPATQAVTRQGAETGTAANRPSTSAVMTKHRPGSAPSAADAPEASGQRSNVPCQLSSLRSDSDGGQPPPSQLQRPGRAERFGVAYGSASPMTARGRSSVLARRVPIAGTVVRWRSRGCPRHVDYWPDGLGAWRCGHVAGGVYLAAAGARAAGPGCSVRCVGVPRRSGRRWPGDGAVFAGTGGGRARCSRQGCRAAR